MYGLGLQPVRESHGCGGTRNRKRFGDCIFSPTRECNTVFDIENKSVQGTVVVVGCGVPIEAYMLIVTFNMNKILYKLYFYICIYLQEIYTLAHIIGTPLTLLGKVRILKRRLRVGYNVLL